MVALKTVAVLVVFFGFALAATTHYLAYRVGQRFPPIGNFATIDDLNIHFIEEQAGDSADLPALVFIHGAGGNARDLHAPLADRLRGRARMIFVDRPDFSMISTLRTQLLSAIPLAVRFLLQWRLNILIESVV